MRNDEGNNNDLRVPQIVGSPTFIYHGATTDAVVLRSEIAVMGNGSEARKTHSYRPQIKVVVFLARHHHSCIVYSRTCVATRALSYHRHYGYN